MSKSKSSKSKSSPRVFSREFKLAVVRRMLAGENVSALARELKVLRKDLYTWRDRFRSGGPEALRGRGRPRKAEAVASVAGGKPAKAPAAPPATELGAARTRIAELERKIGQQQVELDFFRQALRQVKGARCPSNGAGVTGSTRSSKR
jgi:transposase-like protein